MADIYKTRINSVWTDDIRGDGYVADMYKGIITEIQPPLDEEEVAIAAHLGMFGGLNNRRVVQREETDDTPAVTVIRHEILYHERSSQTWLRAEHQIGELAYKLAEKRGGGVEVLREGERTVAMRVGSLATR